MKFLTQPEVTLLATTCWVAEELPEDAAAWTTDAASDGEKLIEFAGRSCYRSWANPSGKSNAEYIEHILSVGHLSVCEHAQATLRFAGVSRSWSHEAVRHRHLSVSQESQRYVSAEEIAFVIPPAIRGLSGAEREFRIGCGAAHVTYCILLEQLERRYDDVSDSTLKKKLCREAARSVLPNATETRLVLTGNLTAWRWFCIRRASQEADAEMCEVACRVVEILQGVAPSVFSDFERQVSEKDGRVYYATELSH
jgi:thymidylate synthase (FAD)